MKKIIGIFLGFIVVAVGVGAAVLVVNKLLVKDAEVSENNSSTESSYTSSACIVNESLVEEATTEEYTNTLSEFGSTRPVLSKEDVMSEYLKILATTDSIVNTDKLINNINKLSLQVSTIQTRYLISKGIEDSKDLQLVGVIDKDTGVMTYIAESVDDIPRYIICIIDINGKGSDFSSQYINMVTDKINSVSETVGEFPIGETKANVGLNDFPSVARPTKETIEETTQLATTEAVTLPETQPIATLVPETATTQAPTEATQPSTTLFNPIETQYYGPGSETKSANANEVPDLIFLQAVISTSTQYNSWASNFTEPEIKHARTKADIDMQTVYDHARKSNINIKPESLFKAEYDSTNKVIVISTVVESKNMEIGRLNSDCSYTSSINYWKSHYGIK